MSINNSKFITFETKDRDSLNENQFDNELLLDTFHHCEKKDNDKDVIKSSKTIKKGQELSTDKNNNVDLTLKNQNSVEDLNKSVIKQTFLVIIFVL
jgi:hypothetical protein